MKVEEGAGGLGGNDFAVGFFTADTFQMGELPVVRDMAGIVGVLPEPGYLDEDMGIFDDGIISHSYLKAFEWTIDFDTMTRPSHNQREVPMGGRDPLKCRKRRTKPIGLGPTL